MTCFYFLELIKENLEILKVHAELKKNAQDTYYRKQSHTSPLIRESKRVSVKQRLGYLPNGTSTSAVPPRLRLRKINRPTANNFILSRRIQRSSAQTRIDRIRKANLVELNQQKQPKKLKLRRIVQTPTHKVTNFQIEVRNNTVFRQPKIATKRFRMILDPKVQADILTIQENFQGSPFVPTLVTPAATKMSTNERFAKFSLDDDNEDFC